MPRTSNNRITIVFLLLACFAPFVLWGCLTKGGNIPAPRSEDIVGTWIATEGNRACFRICLDSNGTGLIGATFHSDPPMVYRITSWHLSDATHIETGEPEQLRNLVMTTGPLGNARPLALSGAAGRAHLKVRLAWKDWSPRWATFYSEDDMTAQAEQTRQAMDKFASE